jgi:hypothetical protein
MSQLPSPVVPVAIPSLPARPFHPEVISFRPGVFRCGGRLGIDPAKRNQTPIFRIRSAMKETRHPYFVSVWSVIVQIWLVPFFFAMLTLMSRLFKLADPAGWRDLRHHLLRQAKCPECGLIYERRWLAVNLGSRRYERCPGCKKWHYTTTWKETASPTSESAVHVDQG